MIEAKNAFAEMIEKEKKNAAIIFLMGLFAHGYMFCNKIPNSDDLVCLNSYGGSITSGRWFLFLAGAIKHKLLGNLSMPWFNGIMGLILLTGAAILFCKVLEIKSSLFVCLIGTSMIVFPVVAGYFTFMFTAPYYCLALLLCVLSVLCWKRGNLFFAIVLSACSIGIYQTMLFFQVGILLIELFRCCYISDSKEAFKSHFYGFIYIVFSALIYLTISKGLLRVLGLSYSSERYSLDIPISEIMHNFIMPYKKILSIVSTDFYGISFNNYIRIILGIIIMIETFLSISLIMIGFARRKYGAILALVDVLLLPFGLNGVFLLNTHVYTLMLYSVVLLIAFLFVAVQAVIELKIGVSIINIVTCAMVVLVSVLNLCYVSYDNEVYFAEELAFSEAKGFYLTLLTRITNTEGYSEESEIYFQGVPNIKSASNMDNYFKNLSEFAYQSGANLINGGYDYTELWKIYEGYEVKIKSEPSELIKETLVDMPCYPEDGSIVLCDNTILVKLGE